MEKLDNNVEVSRWSVFSALAVLLMVIKSTEFAHNI